MSQICELTGKRPGYGNRVSHSNRKTPHRFDPNLKHKKYTFAEAGQTLTLRLSTRAIRTIDKYGDATTVLMKADDKNLSDRLKRVKRVIYKRRVASAQPKRK